MSFISRIFDNGLPLLKLSNVATLICSLMVLAFNFDRQFPHLKTTPRFLFRLSFGRVMNGSS